MDPELQRLWDRGSRKIGLLQAERKEPGWDSHHYSHRVRAASAGRVAREDRELRLPGEIESLYARTSPSHMPGHMPGHMAGHMAAAAPFSGHSLPPVRYSHTLPARQSLPSSGYGLSPARVSPHLPLSGYTGLSHAGLSPTRGGFSPSAESYGSPTAHLAGLSPSGLSPTSQAFMPVAPSFGVSPYTGSPGQSFVGQSPLRSHTGAVGRSTSAPRAETRVAAALTGPDELKQRLQKHGFRELTVKGDGNCQFRALADQLYPYYSEEGHEAVRAQVVQQLRSWPLRYCGFVPEGMEDGPTEAYHAWVDHMAKNYVQGSEVTLSAAADSYGVEIWVFADRLEEITRYVPSGNRKKMNKIIGLVFRAGGYDSDTGHYNSVEALRT